MDINALGSLGDPIAAFATVGTFLYLASQIGQSSEIAKAITIKRIALAKNELLRPHSYVLLRR